MCTMILGEARSLENLLGLKIKTNMNLNYYVFVMLKIIQ
jgi:hypothetical protein